LTNQDRSKDEEKFENRLKLYREFNQLLLELNPEGTFAYGDSLSIPDYTFAPFFLREVALTQYRDFEVPDTEEYQRVLKWKNALISHELVKKTGYDDESFKRMYADAALGYFNPKLPPGKTVGAYAEFAVVDPYEVIFDDEKSG